MAMHKPKKQKRFQDGGDVNEAEMKQRGLDASNKEAPVGFFERLRMGNIDDPKSEAYKKFGAGRGRAESASTPAPESAPAAAPAATRTVTPAATSAATSAGPAAGTSSLRDPQQMAASKASVGMDESDRRREDAANAPSRMPTSPGQDTSGRKPSAAPKVTQSPKAKDTSMDSAIMAGEARKRKSVQETSARDAAVMSDEARKRKAKGSGSASSSNDGTEVSAAQKFRDENKKGVSPILTGLLGFGAGFAGKKLVQAGARKLASNQAKKEAAKTTSTATKSPLRQKTEQLIKEDKNPGRSVSNTNPKTSLSEKTKDLIKDDRAVRSANTSKQVTAKETPFKAAAKTKEREARAAKRRSEMLEENAKRYGLDPKAPGYESAIKAMRKDMDGKDFSFKKGGRVTVSSASKRADGIAQRGKTRGRMY